MSWLKLIISPKDKRYMLDSTDSDITLLVSCLEPLLDPSSNFTEAPEEYVTTVGGYAGDFYWDLGQGYQESPFTQ